MNTYTFTLWKYTCAKFLSQLTQVSSYVTKFLQFTNTGTMMQICTLDLHHHPGIWENPEVRK